MNEIYKEVLLMQVIRTNLLCVGRGTQEDPMRRVTQYWSLEGDLLAQVDPTVANRSGVK